MNQAVLDNLYRALMEVSQPQYHCSVCGQAVIVPMAWPSPGLPEEERQRRIAANEAKNKWIEDGGKLICIDCGDKQPPSTPSPA